MGDNNVAHPSRASLLRQCLSTEMATALDTSTALALDSAAIFLVLVAIEDGRALEGGVASAGHLGFGREAAAVAGRVSAGCVLGVDQV